MRRHRLLLWGGMMVVAVSSLWVASARSERMDEAERALNCAERLLERGELAEASEVLARLVREQPRCASAHALLAEARSGQGRDDLAFEHYRAVADLTPHEAKPYYDLAACCVILQRYDVAERYLARRLHDAPKDRYALRLLRFVRAQPQRT